MIHLSKYIISTGEITGSLTVGSELEVTGNVFMLPPDHAFINGEWDAKTHYVFDDVATERPALALPETHILTDNTDWPLPDIPEGTLVLIDGEEAGTVDETGLVLTFALAGVWQVDLKPPFPWIEASCEVTVT